MGEAARYRFACCFDKATREKQAADKAARQAAYKAQQAANAARAALRAAEYKAQKAARDAARQVQGRRYVGMPAAAAKPQAQSAGQAHAAAFAILDARVARWQQMSDSDHEREEERYETFRDRMRDKSGRY